MKSRFPLFLAVIAAGLLLSGCIQMHSTTVIDKDGSGNATFQLSLSEGVGAAMKEMKAMGGDMGGGQSMDFPAFDEIDKAQLEKAAKEHGVTIKKFSRDPINGREALSIEMSFKDLKGFSYMMNKVMGDGPNEGGMGIFETDDGNYVLRSTTYEYPEEAAAEEAAESESSESEQESMNPDMMGKQMEVMGKLMASMGELEIRMEITVPGDIIATNAPQQEGRTSIWAVDSSNMMTQQENMEPEITFSGKGLKIKPNK